MTKLKIDVKKIDKALLYVGAKGTYLDCALMDNRDGTDQYGNDGFIVQEVSKEKREAGVKGPIIGNWRLIETKKPAEKPATVKSKPADADLDPEKEDDLPF